MTASAAELEVVCLPPAGGSAASFRSWSRIAPTRLRVSTRPRARTLRGADRSLPEVADALAEELADGPQAAHGPFVLAGHSLGGLLAYETARRLEAGGAGSRVRAVVVMGTRPPHLLSADFFAPLVDLSDNALLAALVDLGVVNPALRDSPLRRLFLPALRSDLRLVAGYRPVTTPSLPMDLHAWHAAGDPLAPPELAAQWQRYTQRRFVPLTFAGDHFFPVSKAQTAVEALLAMARATV